MSQTNEEGEFEQYVDQLIQRLRADVSESVIRDGENTLRIGQMTVNLLPNFASFQRTPPELREQCIQSLINTVSEGILSEHKPARSFDEVKPRLRPKVWPRWMFASQALQALSGGSSLEPMPARVLGEHLVLTFVLDSDSSMQTISLHEFESWGYSFEQVLQVASKNLVANMQMLVGKQKNGQQLHSMMAANDNYDSSRFLCDEAFTGFDFEYPRWVFPSSRDGCVVGQTDQLEALVQMGLDLAKDDPKPLPPFPLIDEGTGWQVWVPEKNNQRFAALISEQQRYLLQIYAEQRSLLQRSSTQRKDFAYVAELKQTENCNYEPGTVTHWEKGITNLLPEADFISFDGPPDQTIRWESAIDLYRDYLAPVESIYPRRWRTLGFPTNEQLCHNF